MATVRQVWPIGSDAKITLTGLKNDNGDFINDAVVTAVLKDATGATVTGAESLAFTYVASSQGNYEGILPHTLALLDGRTYTLSILAVEGDIQATLQMARQAAYVNV